MSEHRTALTPMFIHVFDLTEVQMCGLHQRSVCTCVCVCVRVFVCGCVCVCERERERKRPRECVCVEVYSIHYSGATDKRLPG